MDGRLVRLCFGVLGLALSLLPIGGASQLDAALVDPAKYDYHNCVQLAGAMKGAESRQQELVDLKTRAEKSTAGGVVSALTYGAEYRSIQGEMQLIEDVAKRKQCEPPVKPVPPI
jgi:hypothetical protein